MKAIFYCNHLLITEPTNYHIRLPFQVMLFTYQVISFQYFDTEDKRHNHENK